MFTGARGLCCGFILFYFFNISSMRKKKKNSLCFPFKL